MLSQLFRNKEKLKENLPLPLKDWSLELPEATVKLRLELKIKTTEMEEFRVTGKNIKSWIPIDIPKQVKNVENLKNAYILESTDGNKLYLFTNREAVSGYTQAKAEGKDTYKRVLEAHRKSRDETQSKLTEVKLEIARLEQSIRKTEDEFRDSSDNLAYNKAKNDLNALENRQRQLKVKLKEPKPERTLGTALGIQFAALEVIERYQIEEAVKAEKKAIIRKYRGLPDSSEIQLSRRCILDVTWKQ